MCCLILRLDDPLLALRLVKERGEEGADFSSFDSNRVEPRSVAIVPLEGQATEVVPA
jgi:hypothetical protein